MRVAYTRSPIKQEKQVPACHASPVENNRLLGLSAFPIFGELADKANEHPLSDTRQELREALTIPTRNTTACRLS